MTTSTTSVIKHIESEFDDVYRITTENGLILDIFETNAPEIGTKIEYRINDAKSDNYVIMNGIVFNSNDVGILVSFGGLLGTIPMDDDTKKSLKEEISLSYNLIKN